MCLNFNHRRRFCGTFQGAFMHYLKQGAIAVLAVIIAKRLPMIKDYL
jgi:hypothetical protein